MYPTHMLFQYGGTLLAGAEIWTAQMRFSAWGTSGNWLADKEDALADLMDDLATRFSQSPGANGGLGHSAAVTLRWGKFNEIGPDGKYTDQGSTNVLDITPVAGGGGAPIGNIPQLAMAVTFDTAKSRGPAHQGRTYVPMPGASVAPTSSGRIAGGLCQEVADSWASLIQAWGDWPGLDTTTSTPHVVSSIGEAQNQITSVRVGDVLDTIRSRRNALTEVYRSAPVGGV